jgi:hypothetical protein
MSSGKVVKKKLSEKLDEKELRKYFEKYVFYTTYSDRFNFYKVLDILKPTDNFEEFLLKGNILFN